MFYRNFAGLGILFLSITTSCSFAMAAESAAGDRVQLLADRIDQRIAARRDEQGVQATRPATDAEFMRRAYLDIGGKIPPVSELRDFLEDSSPDKRRQLVDRLLQSPNYVTHFTNVWREVLVPEARSDLQLSLVIPPFEAWLRQQLASNTPYDEMVRDLLTVDFRRASRSSKSGRQDPVGFYRIKGAKPENLAGSVSRVFLGVRIECAQCHDHPFEKWTRKDFWGLTAFYAGLRPSERPLSDSLFENVRRHEITIPGTAETVSATFLDGTEPEWDKKSKPRTVLANWILSSDNTAFARVAVNRIWGQFFRFGLVHPVDDFGPANSPSHPQLLDELAAAFAENDYDVQFLIRAITASKTYQLSSVQTHTRQDDPRHYSRTHLRRLTSQQVFRSLAQATGSYEQFNIVFYDLAAAPMRTEIREAFADDPTAEPRISTLQALALMNGSLVADATSLEKSDTLTAIVEFPGTSVADRVEALYLAALSRKPSEKELQRMVKYVKSGGPTGESHRELADVFWTLLNSSEFIFNH